MAYTITNLINEYNSNRALILANSAIKQNGLIAYGQYIPANKGLAHTYTLFSTLPTAGIRSYGDGVAVTDVSGSTTTINTTPYQVTHQKDAAYINNWPGGPAAYFSNVTPLYLNSIFQKMEKATIYGNTASFGDASYTGTGLVQYVKTNSSTQLTALSTASAQTFTSIYAIRFSPFEYGDGAQFAVDVSNGVYYTNPNWDQERSIAGSTGPFMGYEMMFMSNNVLVLPGTNNVAAITQIVQGTRVPTANQINAMLDSVAADSNTIILVNRVGKRILNDIGKQDYLRMQANTFGYSDVIQTWNGVPIILDENISTAETSALWGY